MRYEVRIVQAKRVLDRVAGLVTGVYRNAFHELIK